MVVESQRISTSAQPLKLSQRVAEQIISDIRERNWRVGELLGTEAELVGRYGVARATLTEAVRQVERQGAAKMRRGPGGGLVISAPAADAVSRTIITYFEFSDLELEEQFEAWRIVEVHACALAARRITPEGVSRLRHLLAAIDLTDDGSEYLRRCLGVRIAIADLTGNPALALFMRVMAKMLGGKVVIPLDMTNGGGLDEMRKDLGEIVDAIIAGDAALAQGLALLRIARRQSIIERYLEPGASGPSAEIEGDDASAGNPPEKLAYMTAVRILADIRALGWPQDHRLGDEAELLQRYGVSRWVLRQAIGTLEVHGIIYSKAGQRGGLMIGKPDPAHTITATVLYLSYAKFDLLDLHDVWAMLLENLAGMAARHPKSAESSILEEAAREPRGDEAEKDLQANWRLLLGELGRLGGNRVIALFVAILGRYVVRHRPTPPGDRDLFGLAHRRALVAKAVREGDQGGARRSIADIMEGVRRFYDPSLRPIATNATSHEQ